MAGFAVFTVSVLIWAVPGNNHVAEVLPLQQVSPVYSTLNACLDDLKGNLNARFASAAQQTVKAAKDSAHNANPDDKLVVPRAVLRCLRAPVSADVKAALTED
jgi:outer membrane murein-binding lipoprotein Lpp